MMTVKFSHRRGFTLLEVILALALMAVLMSIVGMAVDTYWRAHDRGRKSVENAQLARALLAQIADDLRSTISTPPDYSTACTEMAENLKSSIDQIQAQSQPTGGSQSGGGDQGGGNQSGGGQGGGGSGQGGGGGPGGGGPGGPGGGGGPPNGDPPSGDGPPGNDAGPPQQDPNSGQDNNDGAPGGGRGGDGGTGSGGGRGGVGGGGTGGGRGGGTSGGNMSGGGGGGSAGGSSAGGSNSATTSAPTQTTIMEDSSQTTEASLLAPRMYGSQYDLQIDISRPLRPDQLRVLGTTPPGASTLQYRLEDPQAMGDGRQFADGGGLPTLPQTTANPMLGLVRQESNRILFAAGSTTTRGGQDLSRPDVLAPEVAGLEFRYFDGTDWLSDWDSDTLQSTPKAIEILLTLRVPQSRTGLFSWNAPAENELLEQHRMVVRLPNQIEAPAADTTATGTSSAGTSSMGGVSSGSGGTFSSGTR